MAAHVVEKVGYRKGVLLVAFVAGWADFIESQGRPPRNVAEYAVSVRQSHTKAYRELSYFREAFPEYETPTELWALIKERAPAGRNRDLLALELGSVQLP